MGKIENIDEKILQKKINEQIDLKKTDEIENLVNKLCELKGLDENIKMPKDFTKKIIQIERSKKYMRKRKMLKVATIVVVAMVGLAGTVYAATNGFDKVNFFSNGFMIGGEIADDVKLESKEDKITWDGGEIEVIDDSDKEDTQILSEENGTADTFWTKKTKYLTTYLDNNEKTNKYQYTDYQYKDFISFTNDTKYPNLITDNLLEKSTLADDISFTKYEDTSQQEEITATYKYNKGTYSIYLSKSNINTEAKNGEDITTLFIDVEAQENQRRYSTKEGIEYALYDSAYENDSMTTAVLSYKNSTYTLLIDFTNMTEEEIHDVLDNIDASKLLEL